MKFLLKKRGIILPILALLVLIAVGWWLISPLFRDDVVDEAFPFDVPTMEEIAAMSPEEAETEAVAIMDKVMEDGMMDEMDEAQVDALEERVMEMAAKMPDHPMEEEMPEADSEADSNTEWVVAAQGTFQDADSFHKGSGTAMIFEQGTNRILRFEDFSSTNGPDLHVLLVENIEAKNHSELGNYIDLGSLKGNIGSQNYEIPEDVDLSQYSGVMIYCMPFHVVFSTAAF